MKMKVNSPLDFEVLAIEPERLGIRVGSSRYYVEAKKNSDRTELLLEDGSADDVVVLDRVSIDNGLSISFMKLSNLNALRYLCICGLCECSIIDTDDIKKAYSERVSELEKAEADALANALAAFYKAKASLEFMWRNRVKGCKAITRVASGFQYEMPNGDEVKHNISWMDMSKIDKFYADMARHVGLNLDRFKLGRKISDMNMDDFNMMPGFSKAVLEVDDFAGFIESLLGDNYQHYRTFLNHMENLKDAYYEIQSVKEKREKSFNAYILGYCDLD